MASTRRTGFFTLMFVLLICTMIGASHASRKILDDGCASPYGQCGGLTCPNGSETCTDAQYICCPANYECYRGSQWYWGCGPAGSAGPSSPPLTPQTVSQAPSASTSPPALSSPASQPSPYTSASSGPPSASPSSPSPIYTSSSPPPHSPSSPPSPLFPYSSSSSPSPSVSLPPSAASPYTSSSYSPHPYPPSPTASLPPPPSPFLSSSLSPASSPGFSSSSAPVESPSDCGTYLWRSYLDKSGKDAPDGNYKETCKQISYDCSTDTVSATCGNAIPAVDPGNAYNFSSLSHATDCSLTGEIMNIWGVLECQPEPETLLSSSSSVLSACDVTYSYQSYLDHSGIEAPDGNYKETCKNIGYDCTTDEIYAECGNGKQGSAHMTAYPYSSFSDASFCEGNLANVDGALQCQLQQP